MEKILPLSPSPKERHKILWDELAAVGRTEDYQNIINLLKPPRDILSIVSPNQLRGKRIGIIGGGLAGLAASFELRKAGAHITIFEPIEDRVGGRVYTYYFDNKKKYYGELGPMRIPVSHETTWYYIDLFRLNTLPFTQRNPNTFIYVRNTRIRNTPEEIERKLYPLFPLTQKERNTPWVRLYSYAIDYGLNALHPSIRKQILKALPEYNDQYASLINLSTNQNFELLNLSQGAISLITSIDPLTGATMYLSYNEVLQDSYPLDYTTLFRIEGGNVNLPLAFYKSLKSSNPKEYHYIPTNVLGRITWKSGTWVKGIYESANNKVALKYTDRKKGEFLEEFDDIICAVPYSVLRSFDIHPLFSNTKNEAIRHINYINAQKTIILCKERFWEQQKIEEGISYTDLPINTIVYPGCDHASCEQGVITASYNLGLDATRLGNMHPDERFDTVKRQIEKVHGLPKGYMDNIVLEHKTIVWDNEPWFRGAVALFNPSQKRIFSYEMLKPEYNNKVFFAGEHISEVHGWMQGALYTGKLAANMLAQAAKQNPSS